MTAVASSKAHGGGGGGGYQEPPGAATDEAGYQGLLDAPSDGMYNEITTDGIGGLGVGAYANVTDGDDGGYMLTSATGSGNSETNQVCVCVCVCVCDVSTELVGPARPPHPCLRGQWHQLHARGL